MRKTIWKNKANLGDAQLFQFVPAYYASMSVKESGTTFDDEGKGAQSVRRYEDFTAMGFLKWLDETANFTNLPSWLDKDIMGRNAFGPDILNKAKADGTKGFCLTNRP
ncbi:unnamed protein product [Pylaiella littoralis]